MSIGARVAAAAAPRPAGVRLDSRLARGPLPVTEALVRGSQIANEIARAQRERRGLDLSAASVTLEPDRTVVGDGPTTEPAAQMECLGRLLHEMTRPGGRGVARSPALEHVVARCLDPDPSARWEHPADVAEQLRFLARTTAPPASVGSHRAWLAILCLGAAVAALGWWWGRRSTPRVAPSGYRFVVPVGSEVFKWWGVVALSPDRRSLIIGAEAGDKTSQLFVQPFDGSAARALPGTSDAVFHAWSADGREMLLDVDGKLQKMPASGGALVTLAPLPAKTSIFTHDGGAWSVRGDALIGQLDGPLLHLAPGATSVGTAGRLDPSRGERAAVFPEFLPDGERYLYLVPSSLPPEFEPTLELVAGRLGSDEVVRLGPATSRVKYAAGYLFSVQDGVLQATPFDPTTLRFTGSPVVVADDVNATQDTGAAAFDVADDGTVLFRPRSRPARFYRLDAQGRKMGTIGPPTSIVGHNVSLMPDASAVIVSLGDRKRPLDLWMFGLDRPTTTHLTSGRGLEFSPAVSSDGRSVYFCRAGPGGFDVYEMSIDPGSPARLVVSLPGMEAPDDVSPDGRVLLFMHDQGTGLDIFAKDLPDGEPRPLVATAANEDEPEVSPDGRWMAYESDATGRWEIYVRSFPSPGPPVQVSTVGARAAKWTPDGRRIVYGLGGRVVYATDFANGRVGRTHELFRTDELLVDILPLPDGTYVAGLVDETLGDIVRPHVIVRWPETLEQPR